MELQNAIVRCIDAWQAGSPPHWKREWRAGVTSQTLL